MGGLFEKKAGRDVRREARVQKELQEKKKTRTTAIIVVTVLALTFAAALFVNSSYVRRTFTVVTIDGVGFTAVQFDFFYSGTVDEYRSFMESIGGGRLPDTDRPHSSQFVDSETGQTWADFFNTMTLERMSELVAVHKAAMDYGFVMSDQMHETVDETVANLRYMAEMNGFRSFNSFLRAYYNTPLNETILRGLIEFVTTTNSFREYMFDSFTSSEDVLEEYYLERQDTLDVFTYRSFLISPEDIDIMDFDDAEDYQLAIETAREEAVAKADSLLDGVVTEDDFIAAAKEHDPVLYEEEDSTLMVSAGERLNTFYSEWMTDASRGLGDVHTAEDATGVQVLFFISRDDNNYQMTEMRQLLILRSEFTPEDMFDEHGFFDEEGAFAEADRLAGDHADYVLGLFTDGGGTEDLLIALMEEYSDDWTEEGLYTEITKYQMVSEIDEWLFAPEREVGNYELIRTEAYGYHLVYFVGFGQSYREALADNLMKEQNYQEWTDTLVRAEAVRHRAFIFTSN